MKNVSPTQYHSLDAWECNTVWKDLYSCSAREPISWPRVLNRRHRAVVWRQLRNGTRAALRLVHAVCTPPRAPRLVPAPSGDLLMASLERNGSRRGATAARPPARAMRPPKSRIEMVKFISTTMSRVVHCFQIRQDNFVHVRGSLEITQLLRLRCACIRFDIPILAPVGPSVHAALPLVQKTIGSHVSFYMNIFEDFCEMVSSSSASLETFSAIAGD